MIPLEVIAERESIYRLLAQTTPENLNKDCKSYTLDPSTRYPNLNKNVLLPHQMVSLYDTDDPKSIEHKPRTHAVVDVPKKRRRRGKLFLFSSTTIKFIYVLYFKIYDCIYFLESHVDVDTLLSWVREQIRDQPDLEVENIQTSFKDGRILCAIINHYRPDLLDFSAIDQENCAKNNQIAFDILEKELGT